MVRISDLIRGEGSQIPPESQLTVTPDTPLSEALRKMQEVGCDNVVVLHEEATGHSVLSKEEVLSGLLMELDIAQSQLSELQQQVESSIADQIDIVQDRVKALVECEKDKLAVAIDNMTEGLIILGESGDIERANPSAMVLLGLSSDSTLEALATVIDGLGLRTIISSKDDPENQGSGGFKVRSTNHKILKMRWNRMSDQWGRFLGNVITVRDITEEELAEKSKTEFIASISHELRTPLTTIQNGVSNILAGVTGKISDKTHDYLVAMKGDCHRLANLVNDLLDMAKLEAGSMPVNRRVMNMASAVDQTIREFGGEAHSRNIALAYEKTCCLSPVHADPRRIHQVLLNLIGNAVQFTPAGGKVTVRTYESGDNVITVVEDTGKGIAAGLQKQIFSKFYQIQRQPGPGSQGTGLGLAICQGIVAMHGGAIWVESEEGKGSRFCFSLPKMDPLVTLYRHLGRLSGNVSEAENFAMMILRLDVSPDKVETYATEAGAIINELLGESDHFLHEAKDLAIQTEDFEAVFVVSGRDVGRVATVQRKVQEIVHRRIRKDCKQPAILPMLGTGFYPADSVEMRNLERITRRRLVRLF